MRAATIVCAILAAGGAARGQDTASSAGCATDTLYVSVPRRWLGTTVGQITIRPQNVEALPGLFQGVPRMVHSQTRPRIAANELSFSPGEPVDSLALLESVRRLQRTLLYSEVLLEGRQCRSGVTDFTVWTRDAWSLRGDAQFGHVIRLSLTDINVLGTARRLTVQEEHIDERQSVSVMLTDPYLFDTRFRGLLLLRNYEDGRAWQGGVRTRDQSPRDLWRVMVLMTQLQRYHIDSTGLVDLQRRAEAATVSRRVLLRPTAIYAVVMGVEHEQANIAAYLPTPTLGKPEVRREFVAPLLGVARRSTTFGVIDWLVPGQPPAEFPTGLEGEAVLGIATERTTQRRITHLDSWAGATLQLSAGTILTGDVWSSGYWSADSVSNGTLRFATGFFRRAPRGMWIVRAASERIFNPDPDVFALSTIDPLLRSLAPQSRLAEWASSASIERAVHLRPVEGRWTLDGAMFLSYSERHRSIGGLSPDAPNLQAIVLGIGLRRVRNQPTQAPLHLDIGHTVWHSGVPGRWVLVLQSAPWINVRRVRDGVREGSLTR